MICTLYLRSLYRLCLQVRSLTLDTLKPEWLQKLKEFGNKNSNAIYEKNLPEDFDRGIYLYVYVHVCVCVWVGGWILYIYGIVDPVYTSDRLASVFDTQK